MWNVECGIVVRCGKATAEYTAPLRSALHSYRTFTTRGRYFFGRSGFAKCGMWNCCYTTLRSAGVLFPEDLVQNAAYEAFLRVQSERSERLRELTPAARRRINNDCKRAKKNV